MIGRTTRLVLLLFGGLLAVCIAVFGGLYLYLAQGPISLSFIKAPFERIVNANTGDIRVSIHDAVIEREENSSAIRFRLRGIELTDAKGTVVARAPRAAIGVGLSALLAGRFAPTRLELIGPRINLIRDHAGGLRLGFDEGMLQSADRAAVAPATDQTASAGKLAETLLGVFADPGGASDATALLEEIAVRDGVISLFDENNNAEWYAPNADFHFNRIEEGVSLSGSMTIESGKLPWHLNLEARYRKQSDDFTVSARVSDFVPAEIAGKLSVLSNLAEVRLPLSGQVAIMLDRQGGVRAGTAQFGAGAGFLGFPGVISEPILVDEGQVNLNYDPNSGEILMTDSKVYVGDAQVAINGSFTPVIVEKVLEALTFDLSVQQAAGGKAGTMLIDRLLLGGSADLVARRIEIARFAIEAGDARIVAAGRITEGPEAPGLIVRGKISNLPFELLKKLWPPLVSPGARKWVVENVSEGLVTDADIKIDLAPQDLTDALNDRTIANELIDVVFRYRGATARYFGELPEFEDARGTGKIRGDDFELALDSARVEAAPKQVLSVTKGRFYVSDFARKGPLAEISGVVTGSSESALRVLDGKPLEYMKKFGLDPQRVGGDASVGLAMRFPLLKELPLEAVGLKARAHLGNLTLPNVLRDVGIEGGSMTLDVDTKGIAGSGNVTIAGVTTKLDWTERFDAASESSRFVVETTLDDKERIKLGIDLSEFVSGPITFRVSASGKGHSIDKAHVEADLSSAVLYYRPIGWVHPSTKTTTASFDVELGDDFTRLRDMSITGPNLAITGAVRVDKTGRVLAIDLPNASLGPDSKLSVTGQRDAEGVLRLDVKATAFDARALLKSRLKQAGAITPGASAASDILVVNGAANTALAFGGEQLSNVSFALRARGDIVESLDARGNIGASATFKVAISGTEGGGRGLRIDSSDAGRALRAVDLYSKIAGGDFKLTMELPSAGSDGSRSGQLKLKDFIVKNEKVLREIPLDKRRDSLAPRAAANNDFAFDSLTIPFTIKDDTLEISQAFLKGSAIGASAQGVVDTRTDEIELGGTLIPAYELNSFISHVPLVGDVLTGGKGQGVFGITFAVTGTTEQPRIQINPVSALMPGIFRKMFEFGGAPRSGQQNETSNSPFDEPNTFR